MFARIRLLVHQGKRREGIDRKLHVALAADLDLLGIDGLGRIALEEDALIIIRVAVEALEVHDLKARIGVGVLGHGPVDVHLLALAHRHIGIAVGRIDEVEVLELVGVLPVGIHLLVEIALERRVIQALIDHELHALGLSADARVIDEILGSILSRAREEAIALDSGGLAIGDVRIDLVGVGTDREGARAKLYRAGDSPAIDSCSDAQLAHVEAARIRVHLELSELVGDRGDEVGVVHDVAALVLKLNAEWNRLAGAIHLARQNLVDVDLAAVHRDVALVLIAIELERPSARGSGAWVIVGKRHLVREIHGSATRAAKKVVDALRQHKVEAHLGEVVAHELAVIANDTAVALATRVDGEVHRSHRSRNGVDVALGNLPHVIGVVIDGVGVLNALEVEAIADCFVIAQRENLLNGSVVILGGREHVVLPHLGHGKVLIVVGRNGIDRAGASRGAVDAQRDVSPIARTVIVLAHNGEANLGLVALIVAANLRGIHEGHRARIGHVAIKRCRALACEKTLLAHGGIALNPQVKVMILCSRLRRELLVPRTVDGRVAIDPHVVVARRGKCASLLDVDATNPVMVLEGDVGAIDQVHALAFLYKGSGGLGTIKGHCGHHTMVGQLACLYARDTKADVGLACHRNGGIGRSRRGVSTKEQGPVAAVNRNR